MKNIINIKTLKENLDIISTTNVSDDTAFTYIDICGIQNEILTIDKERVLFVPTYALKENLDGWYKIPFDRRNYISDVTKKHPEWTYILTPELVKQVNIADTKAIIVDNIEKFVDDLYAFTLEKHNFTVIGATGSVGKTTFIGLVHHILKNKFDTLRIYSKRITPINLKSNIVNFLKENTKFVVLEYALYDEHHIKRLTELLKPNISFMLNVKDNHTDRAFLDSLAAICYSKSEILLNSEIGFLNADDDHIKNLRVINDIEGSVLYYKDRKIGKTLLKQLKKVSLDNSNIKVSQRKIHYLHKDHEYIIDPYYFSELTVYQIMMVLELSKHLNLEMDNVVDAINTFNPPEKRYNKERIFGREMFFDADISTNSRLDEISKNFYPEDVLIIRNLNIGESDKINYKTLFNILKRFDKTYIFRDSNTPNEILELVDSGINKRIKIVDDHNFIDTLGKDTTIIYHYGGYYRKNEKLSEKALRNSSARKYKTVELKTKCPRDQN